MSMSMSRTEMEMEIGMENECEIVIIAGKKMRQNQRVTHSAFECMSSSQSASFSPFLRSSLMCECVDYHSSDPYSSNAMRQVLTELRLG